MAKTYKVRRVPVTGAVLPDVAAKIARLAKSERRSVSEIVSQALEEFFASKRSERGGK